MITLRRFACITIVLAATAVSTPVQAGWFRNFVDNMIRDTRRNNAWPEPFPGPDRQSVREPFVLMVQNGWRRQNMLSDYHFDTITGQLTEVGQKKVHAILNEAPVDHRVIFVHQARTAEKTAARISVVYQSASKFLPPGVEAVVQETSINDTGWSGSTVDAIERQFNESIPAPRLP